MRESASGPKGEAEPSAQHWSPSRVQESTQAALLPSCKLNGRIISISARMQHRRRHLLPQDPALPTVPCRLRPTVQVPISSSTARVCLAKCFASSYALHHTLTLASSCHCPNSSSSPSASLRRSLDDSKSCFLSFPPAFRTLRSFPGTPPDCDSELRPRPASIPGSHHPQTLFKLPGSRYFSSTTRHSGPLGPRSCRVVPVRPRPLGGSRSASRQLNYAESSS
ncbi:hypothetical protein K402DRAFT_2425 [Aulographum hederae CBS 113979]|uniref:Uncharacterized protein n=1 Tax=Aulographum hederae CBS 113979 TaxID=1176131 RepID=A0A6G1HGT5_9PEZI|nr:hypothetical protein K402DRAFT_2425 [Aulographum hederae CBS 113979]